MRSARPLFLLTAASSVPATVAGVGANIMIGAGRLRPRLAYLGLTLATALEPPVGERRPDHPTARARAAAVRAKERLETRPVEVDTRILQTYAEVLRDRVRDRVDGGDRAAVVVALVRDLLDGEEDMIEVDRLLVQAARAAKVFPTERQYGIAEAMLSEVERDVERMLGPAPKPTGVGCPT